MSTATNTLYAGLQEEIKRVKKIIAEYERVPKGAGMLAAAIMKNAVREAEQAITDGDTVAMIRSYQELKTFEL